ncbi:LLM class oxidoreductase [Herbiconiux daphne]|uniref:LLM class flavin-dependent oxidoreductase n=1 Tax=Herbiconiux daphne TaxID=2970914 RepID=A0ABT2H8N6_9MICO|nr:LLM class flavin-dependent oxidoreductase [Herbiconiux daphne]MCS5736304.1 LLM class flavin-dependent oxidoreductase [Herbiconiux daphne]
MTHMTRRLLAVGLSGPHLVALTGQPGWAAELDGLGLAFIALGVDRVTEPADGAPLGSTVDSSVAATVFATDAPNTAVVVVAAPHRDHPYNLGRRVASLDHLSSGRTGLLLGERDRYAPAADAGRESWSGARLSQGAPLEPATTRDAALALQKLWQSWPADTIVGDRTTGIYAEAERIVHIDHDGVFSIAGPLNVPSTPQGAPVIGWVADRAEQLEAAAGAAELLVVPASLLSSALTVSPAVPVFALVPVDTDATAHEVAAAIGALDPRANVLLVPDARLTASGIALLVRDLGVLLPELAAPHGDAAPATSTLRDRLGLGSPAPLLAGARSAFPAPSAEVAR